MNTQHSEEPQQLQFLTGGGEMGLFTREKDWSKTPLGPISGWPQSLRTTLSIILNSKFPMFLWWGPELTCFYNDAYRPSLGQDGKHPHILGMSAQEAWPEIWDIIKPMIDQVLAGGPAVWNENQLVPIFRNGQIEDVYWTFSYSPVNAECGNVAGVLVTCTETTQQIKTLDTLKTQANQLEFIIDAAELGTWDLNPATNRFTGNDRLKEWFGLSPEEEIDLSLALNVIHENDRQRVSEAIAYALNPVSGGTYDIEYTIVHPVEKKKIKVLAKGRAEFDVNHIATRFSGTLEDITEVISAQSKLYESEYRFRTLIEEASVATAFYTGPEIRIQYANDMMLGFWGKGHDVIGKPISEALPELAGQPFLALFDEVYRTGKDYVGSEQRADIEINGIIGTFYFTFTYKALRDKHGIIYGIHHMATDVTEQVKSRLALKESEKKFREMVRQAPVGITILRGPQFIVEMANQNYLELVDKKEKTLVGRSLFETLPEVKEIVEPLLLGVLNTGVPFQSTDFSVTLNRFGKEELAYFNLLYHPLREEDGAVTGVMVVATEVTGSVKAKHRLAESEKHFRNMVMQSPIPMTIFRGPDHVIEMANEVMFEKIWRRQEHEVLGKGVLDAFPELREQKYGELLNNVFRTGEKHRETESLAYVEGSDGLRKFYLDFEYAPLYDTEGNISGIIVTVNDVTEKVEARAAVEASEQRISTFIKTAPFPIGVYTGKEMIIEIANQSILQIWGKGPDVIGKPYKEILPELNAQQIFAQLDMVYETGIAFHAYNKQLFITENDEIKPYYFNYSFTPLFDSAGKVYGVMNTAANVTDLNIAKQKVEEDEIRLSLVINASELGTWELDINTNELVYSDRLLEVFGFPKDKKVEHDELLKFIHKDDRYIRDAAFKEAYNTGQIAYVSRFIWPDRSVHWIESKGRVFFDEADKPVRMIGTVRDVTEERNYQQGILESEQKFRLLADSMPQFVWTGGAEGILDYFNLAVYSYTGLGPKDLFNHGWLQMVHPDDRKETIQKWKQCVEAGEIFICEHRFRRNDGEYRWQLSRAIPQINALGVIEMWVGTSTDIQEQKMFTQELEKQVRERTQQLAQLNEELARSEERYHLMVSEVQEYAILYLNKNGIVENWNRGAQKIKGYEASEIIGKSFSVFYTDQDRQNNLPFKLLKQAEETGKAMQEGMRVRKDGTLFWANVVITAIHNQQKEVIGFSKVTHDLTEKKIAEERLRFNALQLEEKNSELEKMNTELQSFAYISSHDLQEPLRKIQIFSARIIENELQQLSDKGKDYFARMQSSANRMQTLIKDLLTYSRTNVKESVFVTKDLNDIVDEVRSDMAEIIAKSQAEIRVLDLCEFSMIPFQMVQLLQNLIGNALKFARADVAPVITIRCATVTGADTGIAALVPSKKYCHIIFSDNGIGFEDQYKERIFEVFQRLHENKEYSGTGIGLAIVKRIVENHKGVIAASGIPNEGARFDIYIPYS